MLKPGGLLLFTVHGERFLGVVTENEKGRFMTGHLVTQGQLELAGSNHCGAFHPVEYAMGDLLPKVEVELIEAVHDDPTGETGHLPVAAVSADAYGRSTVVPDRDLGSMPRRSASPPMGRASG